MSTALASEREHAPGLRLDGHVPVLDGIRGMAVLLVMVFHFCLHGGMNDATSSFLDVQFLNITGSGWIGVDLFFVMSGFLITGMLWNSRDREGYFRVFYTRRFLRIFPLYYAYLAVRFFVIPLAYPQLAVAPHNQWLFWTYLSNTIPMLSHLDSFHHIRPAGLVHFWSLAVEEQFYLVWPLLVWKLNRRQLIRLCAVLVCITPLVRLALSLIFEPMAAYEFSLGRLDAFGVGAGCAILARGVEIDWLRRMVRPVLKTCAIVLAAIFIGTGKFYAGNYIMLAVGYSAVALMAGALLIRALDKPGVFGWRWLQWLGGLCYGLYVFNGPLGHMFGAYLPVSVLPPVFGSYIPAQIAILAAALATNVLIAWVVWHGFEKHFNNLKKRVRYGPIVATRIREAPYPQLDLAR